MLGSLILYLKGMRIMMFQLSGFYCKGFKGVRRSRVDCLGFEFKCFRFSVCGLGLLNT